MSDLVRLPSHTVELIQEYNRKLVELDELDRKLMYEFKMLLKIHNPKDPIKFLTINVPDTLSRVLLKQQIRNNGLKIEDL